MNSPTDFCCNTMKAGDTITLEPRKKDPMRENNKEMKELLFDSPMFFKSMKINKKNRLWKAYIGHNRRMIFEGNYFRTVFVWISIRIHM